MDPLAYLYVILVCFTMAFCDGVEGVRWNISAKEDLEFEKQVKVLNKPSIKTIHTDYGVTYDCVDFYKQAAFDYALMNNYTIEYEKPISLHNNLRDPLHIGTKGDGCPIGSVPVKRITKEDLIREKLASQRRTLIGVLFDSYYAVSRPKPSINKFVGAGCELSVWTPRVGVGQYSAARLKISNGGDSIEAGWRVDPTLYGDNATHLYIRTDAGSSHCLDTRCGFVILDTRTPIGGVITQTSKLDGPVYDIILYIVLDTITGNWNLLYGEDHLQIGFWPKSLFTGLANFGASVEWGGEVFSPPGTSKPEMGTGSFPNLSLKFDLTIPIIHDNRFAYFKYMSLLDGQKTIVLNDLDSFATSPNYQVKDVGGSKMFYGGSGGL